MANELVGLLVGRFQPFHRGHLKAVHFALERVRELYIGVGSSQLSHEARNPFTTAERIAMIRAALLEEEIDPARWCLIPIPDVEAHALWVDQVNLLVPRYDLVFSNDPLTQLLFRERGVRVIEVPLLERSIYSATEVRRRMIEGGDWHSLVPPAVARIIESIDGVSRVRSLK
jgi:nicotinamide-nucleotide adenylyltransferase